jgi:hypothetical protein
MGRRIAYLPAYYIGDTVVPAAAPFLLGAPGGVDVLDGGPDAITITVGPEPRRGAGSAPPVVAVKPGSRYELFLWDDEWRSLGLRSVNDEPVTFESVEQDRLYWLVAEGSQRLERIFTIGNGRRVGW